MFEYDNFFQCPVGSPVPSDADVKSQCTEPSSIVSEELIEIMTFWNQNKTAAVCNNLCANNHYLPI